MNDTRVYATSAALTTRVLPEDDVEVEGVGWVRVRALNRWEMLALGKLAEKPSDAERTLLSYGMVEPKMTEPEVGEWQRARPAMNLQPVLMRINELSGIGKGAAKSDVSADGDGPGA